MIVAIFAKKLTNEEIMENKRVRTRFAPSPTGFMHVGNLRTALYAYLFARHNKGDFILRIEDTDQEREVKGAVELIYRTLEKAGLQIDEGPLNGGSFGPYVQSERKALYAEYAQKLVELGGGYYCFCDKERLESLADEKGIRKYDKHCLHLTKEDIQKKLDAKIPYVIRQNIPHDIVTEYEDLVYGKIVIDSDDLEDNILLKSDGMPTYNFANVVDDHLMGITHVIRGSEYLSSTPKYNLMYDVFGWDRPVYMHLPPIMKDATRKLSKRYGDANFEDFIAKGYLPEAIVNYIALLGWGPGNDEEKMTMDRMIEIFSVSNLTKSSSIFNEEKMRWLNGLYIRELSPETFLELATPYFEQSTIKDKYDYSKFAKILQPRVEILSEIADKVLFINDFKSYDTNLFFHKKLKTDATFAKEAISVSIPVIENLSAFNHDTIYEALSNLAENKGWKKGQLLSCLRVALTGLETTPGGSVEVADILGKEETLRRLNFSLSLLS